MHLADFADRSVRALSGGQQQRVAVARALAVRPKLLLLDEPFSALDRKLRETMQIELRRLLRELGTTAVFVTHDQDEALTMSDRIAVMNRGAIEQFDTPEAIYRRPATAFALEFVGLSSRARRHGRSAPRTAWSPSRPSFGRLRRARAASSRARRCCWRCGPSASRSTRRATIALDAPACATRCSRAPRCSSISRRATGDQLMVETADLPHGVPAPGTEMTLGWAVADTLVYPAP